jgi:hypothetical protein
MRDVSFDAGDYGLRSVFRWYSKTFSTPLHTVEALPLEEVLRHYFEARYEEMDAEAREVEIERLTTTPEELRRKKLSEDAADAEALEFGKEAEEEEKEPAKSSEARLAEAIKELQVVTPLKTMETLPPDVHLSFSDE